MGPWVARAGVPVTVIVSWPGAVVLPTLGVSAALPSAVTEAGFSDELVPAGSPLVLRLIDSAEPLVTAVEIVDEPLAPCWTETLLGLALIEKSFVAGALTVRVTRSEERRVGKECRSRWSP